MKRRSREINIFSMSALDLFASALGAFILISVVLFPYFPNIGDSVTEMTEVLAMLAEEREAHEETKEALMRERRENEDKGRSQAQEKEMQSEGTKALESCAAEKNICENELKKVKIPAIDLAIVLDITGSMTDEIAGLKGEIIQLINVLDTLAPSVGMGIVVFGDRYFNYPTIKQPVLEITNTPANLNALKTFVDGIRVDMGAGTGQNLEEGEAIDLGLEQAVRMNWRSDAQRRYIIVVTDDLVTPAKMEYTYRMARDFASNPGNTLSVVSGTSHSGDVYVYLRNLAGMGNGEFVDVGGSMIGSILMAILGT